MDAANRITHHAGAHPVAIGRIMLTLHQMHRSLNRADHLA
jgi:hypothetical protein